MLPMIKCTMLTLVNRAEFSTKNKPRKNTLASIWLANAFNACSMAHWSIQFYVDSKKEQKLKICALRFAKGCRKSYRLMVAIPDSIAM